MKRECRDCHEEFETTEKAVLRHKDLLCPACSEWHRKKPLGLQLERAYQKLKAAVDAEVIVWERGDSLRGLPAGMRERIREELKEEEKSSLRSLSL